MHLALARELAQRGGGTRLTETAQRQPRCRHEPDPTSVCQPFAHECRHGRDQNDRRANGASGLAAEARASKDSNALGTPSRLLMDRGSGSSVPVGNASSDISTCARPAACTHEQLREVVVDTAPQRRRTTAAVVDARCPGARGASGVLCGVACGSFFFIPYLSCRFDRSELVATSGRICSKPMSCSRVSGLGGAFGFCFARDFAFGGGGAPQAEALLLGRACSISLASSCCLLSFIAA